MHKYNRFFYLCIGVITVSLCACGQPKEPELSQKISDTVNQGICKEKVFRFTSSESVKDMGDEDLVYILDNHYVTDDFFEKGSYHKIDLFDVEMQVPTTQNPNAASEYIMTIIIDKEEVGPEFDLLSELSAEFIKEYAVADCNEFMDMQNSMDPGEETGTQVKDKKVIFCGETDGYIEYSARYTDCNSLYENNRLVTHKTPRAYRRVYMKSILMSNEGYNRQFWMLGELSKEYIEEQLDIYLENNQMLYREVVEQENRFVYTQYYAEKHLGDFGLDDEACLYKHMTAVDKQSHEISFCSPEKIKSVIIPGTAVEWPTWD